MIYAFITTNMLMGQALFAKTYGGTSTDWAFSIIQTTDGGYAVTGYTTSFGVGNEDFFLLKLNPDGSLAWGKTYGGTGHDYTYSSLIQTADGGFALAGETNSFGAGNQDILLLKLNSDGSLAWARTYGGTGYDCPRSILQAPDGGFVLAGTTASFGAGSEDFLVLKLNSNGSVAWARTYGGTGSDNSYSMVRTTDGGYAVAGGTRSFGAGNSDFLVLKLNTDGSVAWARTFGGTSNDDAYSFIQTTDGGFVLAGMTASFGTMGDIYVLKINSNGSIAWAKAIGGASDDWGRSVTQTADGGYGVTGITQSFGSGNYDLFVCKLNPDGSLAWARTFGGTDNDYGYSVIQGADGYYAIAGVTLSFGAGYEDIIVLRLDQNGNYSGCFYDCSPTVTNSTPSTSSPNLGASCSPQISSPSPTVGSPTITVTDACPPGVEEGDMIARPWITCSPVPGAALFISTYDIGIKIYKSDGRIAYSGELHEGENRLSLEPGVYLWKTLNQSGKVAVR
ncbi:MAG: hypothetical protein ABIN66_06575 [candidate division WOR-3 bacterium]